MRTERLSNLTQAPQLPRVDLGFGPRHLGLRSSPLLTLLTLWFLIAHWSEMSKPHSYDATMFILKLRDGIPEKFIHWWFGDSHLPSLASVSLFVERSTNLIEWVWALNETICREVKHLQPAGDVWQCLGTFWDVTTVGGCYRTLASRGPECSSISRIAQASALPQRMAHPRQTAVMRLRNACRTDLS